MRLCKHRKSAPLLLQKNPQNYAQIWNVTTVFTYSRLKHCYQPMRARVAAQLFYNCFWHVNCDIKFRVVVGGQVMVPVAVTLLFLQAVFLYCLVPPPPTVYIVERLTDTISWCKSLLTLLTHLYVAFSRHTCEKHVPNWRSITYQSNEQLTTVKIHLFSIPVNDH